MPAVLTRRSRFRPNLASCLNASTICSVSPAPVTSLSRRSSGAYEASMSTPSRTTGFAKKIALKTIEPESEAFLESLDRFDLLGEELDRLSAKASDEAPSIGRIHRG